MLNADIPTDSVYKFLTVVGLAILVFAGYAVWAAEQKRSAAAFEVLTQQVQVNRLFAEAVAKANNCEEALKFLGEARSNSDRILAALPALLSSSKDLEFSRKFMPWVAALGAAVFGVGLYLWITRTQQYVDRLVRRGKT